MKKSKDRQTPTGVIISAVDDSSIPNGEEKLAESDSSTYEEIRAVVDVQGSSSTTAKIAGFQKPGDNKDMNILKTLFKNEIVQALSLVATVIGLAIAAVQLVFGVQFDAIKATLEANEVRAEARYDKLINKIDEMDRRYELRQSEAEKRATLYQEQTDRYIDAKTGKR